MRSFSLRIGIEIRRTFRTIAGGLWVLSVAGTVLLGSAGTVYAQDLDQIVRAMDGKKLEELLRLLPQAEAKFPGHPVVLYLKGLLSEDAELALGYYEELLGKHPESSYADDALYRICQYYFAKGLYTTCRLRCQQLLQRYPGSERRDDAEYLLASAFFASGQFDSAYVRLREFVRKYPASPLLPLVRSDLQTFRDRALRVGPGGESKERPTDLGEKEVRTRPAPEQPERGEFTVQVGAFRQKANALRQQRILAEYGYRAEIVPKQVGGRTYHTVWVGRFTSYQEADVFGRELGDRLGLPYRVVPVR